jgi:hypothetical protein
VETGQLPRIFGIAKVDAASRLYAFESSIGVAIA